MKILLNMGTLRKTGGLVVGLGLCQGLIDNNTDDEFHLIYPSNCGYEKFADQKNWHLYENKENAGTILSRLWVDQVVIPRIIKEKNIDVLLTTTSFGTFKPKCKHCVFIQLPYLAYGPSELKFKRTLEGKAMMAFINPYFKRTIKSADGLIVQTPVMQKRISEKWNFDINKVFPVWPAVSLPKIEDIKDEVPDGVERKKYFVYPAAPMAHKNFIIIPEVLRWLRDRGHEFKMVLTIEADNVFAQPTLELAEKLKVRDMIVQTGQVSHNTALSYIRNAFAMLMPTLLETFGIPYLEAMVLRCPILTSDIDFAHGVCGEAAEFFDPYSAESIGQKVLECLEPEKSNALADAGERRIKEFFSSRTNSVVAGEFLEVLKKL